MSNLLVLKKGLDIPLKGAAARELAPKGLPGTVAVKPTDIHGLLPRLLVKEGDRVLAGSPVIADKNNPSILMTSPVSGTVKSIVRGEKRKLLAVVVEADAVNEYAPMGEHKAETAEEVRDLLLRSGLWLALIQRPYGVMANPELRPKAIFVSSFSSAPLAPDSDFTLGDSLQDIQAGINALALLTDGGVHVGVRKGSAFGKLEKCSVHVVKGPHPAGNVGVQISHIAPILKGETVWTVSLRHLAAIGRLVNTGRVDLRFKLAVTGPGAINPSYTLTLPGAPVKSLTSVVEDIRVVGGDVLSGENIGPEGYTGFFDDQITLLREGYDREILGWAKPFRFNVHSTSWCYFSWLTPWRKYDMDTNLHGGPRAFVQSKCFEDVTPMDIFPIYLIKACLAGEIEKMEKFGIYEVLPEDLALCDYVDPSKNDIQAIIRKGIDLMIKEMA